MRQNTDATDDQRARESEMDDKTLQSDRIPEGTIDARFTEFSYLKRLDRWTVIAGAPVILFYTIVNYHYGYYLQALFFSIMFLDVATAIVLFSKLTSIQKLRKVKMVCGNIGFAIFAIALINGMVRIDLLRFFPWIFFFPMLAIFYFGYRRGLYLALVFSVISTGIVFSYHFHMFSERHQTMFLVNTIVVLVITLVMAYAAEKARRSARQDMLALQNRYKLAELNQRRTNANLEREILLRIESEKALSQSELRYRTLFEESSVSLWEEDWSRLKRLLDELPQEAADNLRSHLESNPTVYAECVSSIRVTAVNRATLALYGADSFETLLKNLKAVVPKEARSHMIDRIVRLYQTGRYKAEKPGWSLNGSQRKLLVSSTVPAGSERSWQKIFTSVYDIT